VFSALNFIVALIAAGQGASDAAGQKISASILLGVIGGVLYYFGNKKNNEKNANIKTDDTPSSTIQLKDSKTNQSNIVDIQSKEHNNSSSDSNETKQESSPLPDIDNPEEDPDVPKPLSSHITQEEKNILLKKYQSEMLSIMADGGTKEQTQVKLEVLLGKREKTEAMLAIENELRSFFRDYYKMYGDEILNKSHNNDLLRKLVATTELLKAHQALSENDNTEERKKMRDIANYYCVSIHLIDDEEYNRALEIYRDGKTL
jgi:hypothetical protein